MGWKQVLVGVGVVVALLGAALLARTVWPQTAEPELRATLDSLRASHVPVLVILPQVKRELRAEVRPDGYQFTIVRPDIGDLTLRGTRGDPGPPVSNEYRWSVGDTTYTLRPAPGAPATPGAPVRTGAVSLDAALREHWGFLPDTPLLYGLYLPVTLVLGGWALLSLLVDRPGQIGGRDE